MQVMEPHFRRSISARCGLKTASSSLRCVSSRPRPVRSSTRNSVFLDVWRCSEWPPIIGSTAKMQDVAVRTRIASIAWNDGDWDFDTNAEQIRALDVHNCAYISVSGAALMRSGRNRRCCLAASSPSPMRSKSMSTCRLSVADRASRSHKLRRRTFMEGQITSQRGAAFFTIRCGLRTKPSKFAPP